MDNKEALEILQSVYDELSSMSDDDLFNHMMSNSPSFKSRVEKIENSILFVPVTGYIMQNTNAKMSVTFTPTAAEYFTATHNNDNLNEGDPCQIVA